MGERIAILHIGQHKTGSTSIQHSLAGYDDGSTFYATFNTKTDLESVLGDLSDEDLSGLDKMLSEYGIAGEKFITAEQKLYRLFYTILVERVERSARHLFNNPGRNLQKSFYYRVLKHLSKYCILSATQREALEQAAIRLRNSWITRAGSAS